MCTNNFLELLKVIGIFMIPAMIIPIIIGATLAMSAFLSMSIYSSNLDRNFGAIGIGTILLIIVMAIISGFISLFATLVNTKILDDANKGNVVSWKSATRYVWNRVWSAIGLNILAWFMFLGVILVLVFLVIILSLITLGIGAFIVIPCAIAIIVIISPFIKLFNSIFIVNDLGVIDSIREAFLLFKKGYFWSTIGKLAAISGIYIGVIIVLWIFELLPFIGFIIAILGQVIMNIYVISYLNILVLDRIGSKDNLFRNNDDSGNSFIDPII
nr:hypothetical protein [Clostridium gallinarum]